MYILSQNKRNLVEFGDIEIEYDYNRDKYHVIVYSTKITECKEYSYVKRKNDEVGYIEIVPVSKKTVIASYSTEKEAITTLLRIMEAYSNNLKYCTIA